MRPFPNCLNEEFEIEYYNGESYDEESMIENIFHSDETIHSSKEGENFILILKFKKETFYSSHFMIKGSIKIKTKVV
jgi:hypothetical protein